MAIQICILWAMINSLPDFILSPFHECVPSLLVLASRQKIPVLRAENPAVDTRTICLLPIELFKLPMPEKLRPENPGQKQQIRPENPGLLVPEKVRPENPGK